MIIKINRKLHSKVGFLSVFVLLQLFSLAALAQSSASIKLNLDATEAARNVLHVRETMTVKPGQLTLF
jgi:hypothetical protein